MATRAQLSQDRSRQRRDALLKAAIDLFAEGGARAITHRAVAARAGLPSATTTYYFESIDELISEAFSDHITEWMRAVDALTSTQIGPEVSVPDATAMLEHVFAARGPEVASVELSVYLAGAADPRLRPLAAEALSAFENMASRILHAAGLSTGDDVAASVVALITGTALRRQARRLSEQEEARLLAASIRDVVVASFLDEERKAAILREAAEGARSS